MSSLRTRFGIPGMIATVALVFAMTGGAFAAKYLITSTKQISPSVLKKLKGATGPAGANGAAGAQGPAGPAGAAGANGTNGEKGEKGATGTNGTNGTNGKSVKVKAVVPGKVECDELGGAIVEEEGGGSKVEVCNGEEGKDGKEGSPWTLKGTLPVGATLTGTWAFNGTTADTESVYVPISFPIQLKEALEFEPVKVHYSTEEPGFKAICKGNSNEPTAPSGHLCVYASFVKNATFNEVSDATGGESPAASVEGAILRFTMTGVGHGNGAWAVTGF